MWTAKRRRKLDLSQLGIFDEVGEPPGGLQVEISILRRYNWSKKRNRQAIGSTACSAALWQIWGDIHAGVIGDLRLEVGELGKTFARALDIGVH